MPELADTQKPIVTSESLIPTTHTITVTTQTSTATTVTTTKSSVSQQSKSVEVSGVTAAASSTGSISTATTSTTSSTSAEIPLAHSGMVKVKVSSGASTKMKKVKGVTNSDSSTKSQQLTTPKRMQQSVATQADTSSPSTSK